ncbi:TIGR02569 family protein [Corynebacterium ulcerans]|uniref:TIGR02569 family protein n=1 Tax=Corynebacterium ulcerans TaxID=65058 RepID=UPI0008FADB0F|nr:TIGR02569 family protein [Corynebacterium ulcerans]OIS05164.1 TIGR02569 family protein [Corynebacterium ulcerans]
MDFTALPPHVRNVFHAPDEPARAMGAAWDYGWKVGSVVFSQVAHPVHAAWSSRIREKLQPEGVRIVRPIKSTDGRFINAGWRASSFAPGILTRRVDETVAAALRLDLALSTVDVPASFREVDDTDIFSIADHIAWHESPTSAIDLQDSIPRHLTAINIMPKVELLLRDIDAPNQVVHADMFATTLYAGVQAPTVTDVMGVARPYGYTAALSIIDALCVGAVDEGIIGRFSHVPHLDQLLLRALAYRTAVHALHPDATSNTGTNLEWVAKAVMSKVSVTL